MINNQHSSILTMPSNDDILKMLNKHFKVQSFEKHPKAMMSILFDRAFVSVLGKNFAKKRISKKNQKHLYEYILTRLRNCYGKYLNLTNFKAKDPYDIKFKTNFELVFKTDFGLLYGCSQVGMWKTIFFTNHSYERFDERCREDIRNFLTEMCRDVIKTEPTTADIINLTVMSSVGNREYANKNKFYYLNIGAGFLVLEDYQDFFLAKTFLSPEMAPEDLEWHMPLLQSDSLSNFTSFRDLFNFNSIKIKKPEFLDEAFNHLTELEVD